MANVLFDKGRQGFLDGSIDWDTNTMKAVLVNSGFSPSNTNSVLTDVTGRTVISPTFTSKTVTDGVADAADITFTAVTAGNGVINAIVIYQTAGTSATARVIAFIDSATGLDVTPNGGDKHNMSLCEETHIAYAVNSRKPYGILNTMATLSETCINKI